MKLGAYLVFRTSCHSFGLWLYLFLFNSNLQFRKTSFLVFFLTFRARDLLILHLPISFVGGNCIFPELDLRVEQNSLSFRQLSLFLVDLLIQLLLFQPSLGPRCGF